MLHKLHSFRTIARKLRSVVIKPPLPAVRVIRLDEKINQDLLPRPWYAYGIYQAALQARQLGIGAISVIEFGVAGGNGLVALEKIAQEIEKGTGVSVAVYGFDSGAGMPKPRDYRDLPYIWREGFFGMEQECLRRRLSRSKLILGDVSQTIDTFAADPSTPPIGFMAFDLDYYSSTIDAFKLLARPSKLFVPRVFCYFDDCIGDDWELHSEFTGELLAIKEFNAQNHTRKIAKISGLHYKRPHSAQWHELMYVFHIFDHPLYCKHINPRKDWQLPLVP